MRAFPGPAMSNYQSLARKCRPQTFDAVCYQKPVVTTLKNAISLQRVAHSYLFSGPRGVGKTTLARLFAKALNCEHLNEGCEPCNNCRSCKEISLGSSLDVLEIDGASNRGIDDIRQLNETVLYQPTSGRFKIYIIDEVHMLTKEAFNALLKTLEEPPEHVKFFFATTEPHKVLPTILSRTQRFDLERIPLKPLCQALEATLKTLSTTIDSDALLAVAKCADGSLRDGQSLLDQLVCKKEAHITYSDVASLLGLAPKQTIAEMDSAFETSDEKKVFALVDSLYNGGKDLGYFLEQLCSHYQTLLKCHCGLLEDLFLSEEEKQMYTKALKIYSKNQTLSILDHLISSQDRFQKLGSKSFHLEAILIRVLQTKTRVSLQALSEELTALKESLHTKKNSPDVSTPIKEEIKSEPEVEPPSVTVDTGAQAIETVLRFASVELNGTLKK